MQCLQQWKKIPVLISHVGNTLRSNDGPRTETELHYDAHNSWTKALFARHFAPRTDKTPSANDKTFDFLTTWDHFSLQITSIVPFYFSCANRKYSLSIMLQIIQIQNYLLLSMHKSFQMACINFHFVSRQCEFESHYENRTEILFP